MIQAVTFDPLIGGHQQPLKGSRFHHPKKVTSRIATKIHKILGVTIFAQLGTWAIKQFIDVHRGDHREDLAPVTAMRVSSVPSIVLLSVSKKNPSNTGDFIGLVCIQSSNFN